MRGFCTIATGDEHYYKIAYNLVKSYKFSGGGYPFVILCDQENAYTAAFDGVILLDNPTGSYLDKLKMLEQPPFEETIYIDADCLVYQNIDFYFDFMPKQGVSCFGRALPMDSKEGWFLQENLGEYTERVNYISSLHGGIIFFHDDEKTKAVCRDIEKILPKYSTFKFRGFVKPADEPILALAMAANGLYPVPLSCCDTAFVFYPSTECFTAKMKKARVTYIRKKKRITGVALVHFNNKNTKTERYQTQIALLENSRNIKLNLREIKHNLTSIYFYVRRRFGDVILRR